METLLLKILEVQTEILAELRLLRLQLVPQQPAPTVPRAATSTPPVGPAAARTAASAPVAAPVREPPASDTSAAKPAAPILPATPAVPPAAAKVSPATVPPAAAVAAPIAPQQPQSPMPAAPPRVERPVAAAPAPSSSMLTLNELADLGGQFLDPGQMPRGKGKSVDAAELLREIKAKNKAKSSAFAAFEKFGRDR